MTVTVLLPTYNEEENIREMIDSISAVSDEFEIIIVDSGSTDRTAEITRKKGKKIIVINKRGKGLAVMHALRGITSDYLIMLDSDLTYPASEIPKMLNKLKTCDVVIGSRFNGAIEDGAMTPVNRLGNVFLTFLARFGYGRPISDVCSGMWGFTKKAYKSMNIDAPHFELEANFFVESVKHNLKICEVPIIYKKRGGQTKLSIKDGFRIAWYLVRKRI